MAGQHNRSNALAAIAAATHVGVSVEAAIKGLESFRGVKRRLELFGEVRGVQVYDDFAHHPTAIAVTIAALRERETKGRILAVLEPRSNTMRLGGHAQTLAESLAAADLVFVYARPDLKWDAQSALGSLAAKLHLHAELDSLVTDISSVAQAGDRVLVMSNGDFGGVHSRLISALALP
jgi:UDP-N-acetylmuramate: L-alanyl-gamma-D-glutamyl-meso-diaminopimelate ligase